MNRRLARGTATVGRTLRPGRQLRARRHDAPVPRI